MKRAIYFRFITVIFITALICGMVSALLFAVNEENKTRDTLSELCLAISRLYETNDDVKTLSAIANNDRVTIVAPDGTVIADSSANPQLMENHNNRDEIANAKANSVTTVTRESGTMGARFMYAAVRLQNGDVFRLSRQYFGLWQGIMYQLPIILFSVLAALVTAAFIAGSFTKKLTAPLERIADDIEAEKFDVLDTGEDCYEIGKITRRIKELLVRISASQKQLVLEKDKISFILSNMDEGFVLLDEESKVQLINNSAAKIFDCKVEVLQQSILVLTRNPKIISGIEKTKKCDASSMFDLKLGNTIYSVHISSVSGEYLPGCGKGCTILLLDVTNDRSLREQRSSFFSNASHELKTPITSVLGFSEMLEKGIPDEVQREDIYRRIHIETKRMNHLINDILAISKLESGTADDEPPYEADVAEVAREVVEALSPQTLDANVTINLDCEKCSITANRRRIYELINNLVENAIKYNVPNGTVDICTRSAGDKIAIIVSDTGIGIPAHAQSRIFERFYRVDSGRSKSVGGTGLGLSIVKHIVLNMGGEIAIESVVDKGTKITVELPVLA